MCADESFKSFAEQMRKQGLTDPMESPDGAILTPLIKSQYVIETYSRRQSRSDPGSDDLEPRSRATSPRAFQTSPSEFPLDSRSRRASRQAVDAEKVSILSSKAAGKKPQGVPAGEDIKDVSGLVGDVDVVSHHSISRMEH